MTSTPTIAEPRQQRSRRTLQRIIDAFEQALRDQTFEEVTVGALCERAGCSVGTFYGRVESKDVLLEHVRRRVFDEVQATLGAVLDPDHAKARSLSALLREQISVLVDFHTQRRGVLRAVMVQARRQTAFAGPTRDFNTALLHQVTQSWLVHRDAIAHSDPIIAAQQATLMAAGYLRESIVFAELWPPQCALDRNDRINWLHHLVITYLTGSAPKEDAS
ncbi:MAG: TetR/AcrR family transcriptional regulator [Deltaproteobacteria bacterium]|nr:TetR/AcrR family transcriptional regulator [Deltaproteobacteria bacterium]